MNTLDTARLIFDAAPDAGSPVRVRAGRAELSLLIANLGFTRGAEIGVWKGKWSARLCKDNPALEMLCVDKWATYDAYQDSRNLTDKLEQAYQEARTVLSNYRCRIIREASVKAAALVPDGSLDLCYVDANHGEKFVREDIEAWLPKVRKGGIFSGHDYIYRAEKPHIQVKAAVDKFIAERNISPVFILTSDAVPSFAWVVN